MTGRIVVTAAGVVSPIGTGMEAFGSALWSGLSGIGPSPRFPGYSTAELLEVDLTPWLGTKGLRTLDRGTRFLCAAAQMALNGTPMGEAHTELGLVCGTMFGGVHSIASFDWVGLIDGPALVSPLDFPNTVINAPAGQAGIKLRLRGVNSTISAGLASGLYAIQYAADLVRMGRSRWLITGGMEAVSDEAVLGFRRLKLESPSGRVRPFGKDRDGSVPGEGSALWMIESEESATERGVKPLLSIAGGGASQGSSGAEAIEQAIDEAGIDPSDVGCIIASASGAAEDEKEALALRRVFGERLSRIPVSAPKAATGEAMGGSGAFAAVIAGMALERYSAPPTAGFEATNTGLRISSEPQPFESDYALVNAFSCDGNTSSMVVERWRS